MEPVPSHQEQTQQHQMSEHANYSQPVIKQIRIKLHAIQRVHHAISPQPQLMEHPRAILTIAQPKQADQHVLQCQTLIYPNIKFVC